MITANLSTGLRTASSVFTQPVIGKLYSSSDSASNLFVSLIPIGIPIMADSIQEKGGNQISEQVIVTAFPESDTTSNVSTDGESSSSTHAQTGVLECVQDNIVPKPREWVIHGYVGIPAIGMPANSALSNASSFVSSLRNAFTAGVTSMATIGQAYVLRLMQQYIRTIANKRSPFKFYTSKGETLPALIKDYTFREKAENQNWVEIDIDIVEFRALGVSADENLFTTNSLAGASGVMQIKSLAQVTLQAFSMTTGSFNTIRAKAMAKVLFDVKTQAVGLTDTVFGSTDSIAIEAVRGLLDLFPLSGGQKDSLTAQVVSIIAPVSGRDVSTSDEDDESNTSITTLTDENGDTYYAVSIGDDTTSVTSTGISTANYEIIVGMSKITSDYSTVNIGTDVFADMAIQDDEGNITGVQSYVSLSVILTSGSTLYIVLTKDEENDVWFIDVSYALSDGSVTGSYVGEVRFNTLYHMSDKLCFAIINSGAGDNMTFDEFSALFITSDIVVWE